MDETSWLDYELIGNSLLAWFTAIFVFFAAWIVLRIVHRGIRGRVTMLAASREDVVALQMAEAATRVTKGWFILLLALLVASQFVVWPAAVGVLVKRIIVAALLFQAGFWGTAALGAFLERRRRYELRRDPGAVAALDLVAVMLRVLIWTAVVLLVLENAEVRVTPLVAGLGVGGIAVALAAQNIIGDLFASLSIVLDKPFVVGDFLAVDDFQGSVEKVGIKTTRLRSLSGEQVVLANADLLGSRIRNFGRMYERRVVFTIRAHYQTPLDKVRAIPPMIKEILEVEPQVRFERAHFKEYGEFALVFEIVYFVLSPNFNVYMDIQQRVNLEIAERFAALGIELAYPTQTLYLARGTAAAGAPLVDAGRDGG